MHRIVLGLCLSAICWSALVTSGRAGTPRTASGRVVPFGEKDPYAGVPDILSPRLEFTFDTAGGEIRGSFQGESRKLHRGSDDLLVCVRAAGTFRATFQPQRSGEVSGKAVFSSWQVTVYKMDGSRGTRDTSPWTTDWLRRQEYLAPPADAAFYGALLLESGKGSGAISAEKHFMVQWEVTFPASSGQQPDAPAAKPPATAVMPPAPQVLREFYVTRLAADREEYASGEPVELTVALERWAEVRQQDGSHASLPQGTIESCSFDLVFTFPPGADQDVDRPADRGRPAVHARRDLVERRRFGFFDRGEQRALLPLRLGRGHVGTQLLDKMGEARSERTWRRSPETCHGCSLAKI